jgi:hypothetical protein
MRGLHKFELLWIPEGSALLFIKNFEKWRLSNPLCQLNNKECNTPIPRAPFYNTHGTRFIFLYKRGSTPRTCHPCRWKPLLFISPFCCPFIWAPMWWKYGLMGVVEVINELLGEEQELPWLLWSAAHLIVITQTVFLAYGSKADSKCKGFFPIILYRFWKLQFLFFIF